MECINEKLLSVRNRKDIESIISPTVKESLDYFKNKTVIINVEGMLSTLVEYKSFQWQMIGQRLEFIGFPSEMTLNIELNKIIYIICETDERCNLYNSVEFWLDNDNLVKIWTEE